MTYLSVGEAAKRLGVSVDVVRSLIERGQLRATRTPGNHRRVVAEDVERKRARWKTEGNPRKAGRLPSSGRRPAASTREPRVSGQRHSDVECDDDPPTLEEVDAELEREQARECSQAERQRLEALKKYGRDLAPWTPLPTEWRARLFEDLEEFVTSKRVPPSLSVSDAQLVVFARVQEIVKQHREAENKRRKAEDENRRAEDVRRQKEREVEDLRRKQVDDEQRLKTLIDHGITYARRETITDWDLEDQGRARREVERALRDEVKAHWSEADVKDLVDDVLDDWDDADDGDEDEYEEADD